MTLNDKRIALITAVQAAGKVWDACATADAVDAARKPADKEKLVQASRSVMCSDVAHEIADQAVRLINQHWPSEKDKP
jgi:hypothetical protein